MDENNQIEEIKNTLLAFTPIINMPFECFEEVARAIYKSGYCKNDNEHQIAQGTKLYIIKDGKILEREIADIVFALAQKEAEEGDLFCEYIGFNTMLNNFNKTVFINKNTAVKKLRNKKGDKI